MKPFPHRTRKKEKKKKMIEYFDEIPEDEIPVKEATEMLGYSSNSSHLYKLIRSGKVKAHKIYSITTIPLREINRLLDDREKVLSLKEAEEALFISKCTLADYIKQGKIKTIKVGGRKFISKDEIKKFDFEQNTVTSKNKAAMILGCTCSTINNYIKQSKIKVVNSYGNVMIPMEEIDRISDEIKGYKYTLKDVVKAVNYSSTTILNLIYKGKIKATKIWGKYRFTESEMNKIIDTFSSKERTKNNGNKINTSI